RGQAPCPKTCTPSTRTEPPPKRGFRAAVPNCNTTPDAARRVMTDSTPSGKRRGRDGFVDCFQAIRETFERANDLAHSPTTKPLTGFEYRVLLMVMRETLTYSKLSDYVATSRLAGLVLKTATPTRSQCEKVRQAAVTLDRNGLFAYEAGVG